MHFHPRKCIWKCLLQNGVRLSNLGLNVLSWTVIQPWIHIEQWSRKQIHSNNTNRTHIKGCPHDWMSVLFSQWRSSYSLVNDCTGQLGVIINHLDSQKSLSIPSGQYVNTWLSPLLRPVMSCRDGIEQNWRGSRVDILSHYARNLNQSPWFLLNRSNCCLYIC